MQNLLVRGLALSAFLLVACGAASDDSENSLSALNEPDQKALRELILAATAPPPADAQPPTATGEETQIKTENGAAVECVYKRFTGTELYETLVSFDPNADSIWPGS